jgi:hypothetical protein
MGALSRRKHANLILILLLSVCTVAGCSMGKKNILFVTKTSLGVDIDTKPPALDVGYTRKEATISPKFEGGVLPQMASFKTNVGFVNAAVGQSFATGNAALLMDKYMGTSKGPEVASGNISASEILDTNKDSWITGTTGTAERYFFGTDTSFAVKITFGLETGGYPDSLSLGYKRKEMAFVPIMESRAGDASKVGLPSLIATADLDTASSDVANTDIQYKQFYATGVAASYLAAQPEIREVLGAKIMDDAKVQNRLAARERFQSQRDLSNKITASFGGLSTDATKQQGIFDQAISLGIIGTDKKALTQAQKIAQFKPLIAGYALEARPEGQEKLKKLDDYIESVK